MAKKRVTVYMREEDIDWLENYPVAESTSGSAVLVMEWAMQQIQRGAITALEKLDEGDRKIIIDYALAHRTYFDTSPAMLVVGLADWYRYPTPMLRVSGVPHFDRYKFNTLLKKCEELSPAETIGLLAWACGYSSQKGKISLDEYVKNI